MIQFGFVNFMALVVVLSMVFSHSLPIYWYKQDKHKPLMSIIYLLGITGIY